MFEDDLDFDWFELENDAQQVCELAIGKNLYTGAAYPLAIRQCLLCVQYGSVFSSNIFPSIPSFLRK
jgi:hypothetical protein